MTGPLPESLRMGVSDAYDKSFYDRFMVCVAGVQDDTMSAQDACSDVFDILGYDGGISNNGKIRPNHTSKSRRPDLYRMFVEWSTAAPAVVKEEKTDVPLSRMPGPLPEGLRMGVYEAYKKSDYGHFMRRVVALQAGTISLEVADAHVFHMLGYDGGKGRLLPDGSMDNRNPSRDASSKSHRPDLYRMFVEWSTAAPAVVKEEKIHVPLSRMSRPLPESLRIGVYEAYPHLYGSFMVRVVALHEGTMSLEQADNDVFDILGYDEGTNNTLGRTTLTKSDRPDLYRMFVEWSTAPARVVEEKSLPFSFGAIEIPTAPARVVGEKSLPFSFGAIEIPTAPAGTLCLREMSTAALVQDLDAVDAALGMSPMMQSALGAGAREHSVAFACGQMRLVWQREIAKRACTHNPN